MTHRKLLAAIATAGVVAATMPAPSPARPQDPLVGSWVRTNSCKAFVRDMRSAGLPESILREWLVGPDAPFDPSAPCTGVPETKHSHFFTASGQFGSRDEDGNQVDDGDYRIIGRHTLTFPSHEQEFGYRIKVRYRINGGKLRFKVIVPHPCTGNCEEATAWAISAFYRGPAFTRGR
jgi:hypothetical protein